MNVYHVEKRHICTARIVRHLGAHSAVINGISILKDAIMRCRSVCCYFNNISIKVLRPIPKSVIISNSYPPNAIFIRMNELLRV